VAGAGAYCQFYTTTEYPVLSGDNGYGMFQLTDPSPTDTQIWNWKLNVDGGKSKINSSESTAATWWSSQKAQFNQWNAAHPDDIKPTPINTTEASITFSYAPTPSEKDYQDAIAIKVFNGAEEHYIAWDNEEPYEEDPRWVWHPTNASGINYVNRICGTTP